MLLDWLIAGACSTTAAGLGCGLGVVVWACCLTSTVGCPPVISLFTILPPSPEPLTLDKSIPFSLARAFANGEAFTLSPAKASE